MLIRSTDSFNLVWLVFIFMTSTVQYSHAQMEMKELKTIKPTVDYSNIHSIPVYEDQNMTATIIFIKQAVRKHMHKKHSETVIVLEGKAAFYLNAEEINIKKGDQIIIPPKTSHAVIVKGKKPLKVLSIQSPQFKGKDRIFLD